MTVHFIGAGPGSPDLLTLRAKKLILRSPVCIYAGSLIPKEILEYCPKNAKIINSAKLSLDQIMHEIVTEHRKGKDISRLHSGDLSVWSAMGEQIQRIKAEKIKFTPSLPSRKIKALDGISMTYSNRVLMQLKKKFYKAKKLKMIHGLILNVIAMELGRLKLITALLKWVDLMYLFSVYQDNLQKI